MTKYRVSAVTNAQKGMSKHIGSATASSPKQAIKKVAKNNKRKIARYKSSNDVVSMKAVPESNTHRHGVMMKNGDISVR